jgi:hypothetical protein
LQLLTTRITYSKSEINTLFGSIRAQNLFLFQNKKKIHVSFVISFSFQFLKSYFRFQLLLLFYFRNAPCDISEIVVCGPQPMMCKVVLLLYTNISNYRDYIFNKVAPVPKHHIMKTYGGADVKMDAFLILTLDASEKSL